MASSSHLGHQSYWVACRYRYGGKGDRDKEGIGLVIPRCFLEASLASALDAKTMVSAEISLLDFALRAKAGAEAS